MSAETILLFRNGASVVRRADGRFQAVHEGAPLGSPCKTTVSAREHVVMAMPRGATVVSHEDHAAHKQAAVDAAAERARKSAEQTAAMVRMYEGGATLREVGEAFGMTFQGVQWRFDRAGVPRRPPGAVVPQLTAEQRRKARKCYATGKYSVGELAEHYDVGYRAVEKAISDVQPGNRKHAESTRVRAYRSAQAQRTRERTERVRAKYASGMTMRAIAEEDGVTAGRIWQIIHGWRESA